MYPELFSVVGGVSSGGVRGLPGRNLLENYPQEIYPLQFWLAYGLNEDSITADNLRFVNLLEEFGIPHIYVEDPGIHADLARVDKNSRGWKCIKYISETLGGGVVSVELLDDIPIAWGYIKDQH